MGELALVFSGQGSQAPGMGKPLWDHLPRVREVFACHEMIRPGTTAQCFEGDAQSLSQTINAQPCLYTLSLAVSLALRDAGLKPRMSAGFSLGEISALAFAGTFQGDDGFRFVCERAVIMQEVSQRHPGGMSAVLKLSARDLEALCTDIGDLFPVNYNCPGQLVVAGSNEALTKLGKAVTAQGGRALPLRVSGAFHSPYMDEAAKMLEGSLQNYRLAAPRLPVYANLSAQPYPAEPQAMLAAQVNHPVLWQQTIEHMIQAGVTDFIEVGAGSTLCGLIGKIDSGVNAMNMDSVESFEEAVTRYAKESPSC
jgi:[acyl-carrier-protein] S-malonyltransferase